MQEDDLSNLFEAGMEIKHEGMEVSSDDDDYRVSDYKPPKEEEETPDWAQAYIADKKNQFESMTHDELKQVALQQDIQNQTLKQQLQKEKEKPPTPVAAGSVKKIKRDYTGLHSEIINDPEVKQVIEGMQKLQINNPCALWWVTQWGEEFMQRFKREMPNHDQAEWYQAKDDLKGYARWVQGSATRDPAKKTAGMKYWSVKGDTQPATPSTPSTPAAAGSPFV